MREQLENKYRTLAHFLGIDEDAASGNINKIIKESLRQFVNDCSNPAIWCYGKHTKMMMADFIFEMKGVRFIIDEGHKGKSEGGFSIVGSNQIRQSGIDGVIISSFKYREEIKETLKKNYADIKCLDIYDVLRDKGVCLANEYFATKHPYSHYLLINEYKRKLKICDSEIERIELYQNLIKEYIKIKDFKNAISCAENYRRYCKDDFEIINDLRELYELQQIAIANISQNNVLMLCLDGLRRQDMKTEEMGAVDRLLKNTAYVFQNAYSVSTSTFESLIPAYSENSDMRTKYFEKNVVAEKNCRFIQAAIEQDRAIYFYTDSIAYIDSDRITVTDCAQTVCEKLWNFTLDAADENNGLFYIHILYESHFSYPNPYTEQKIIADGSSIMFDFLPKNGEQLRTDYCAQHRDTLAYINDILYVFLSELKLRFVLFADHGGIILPKGTQLQEVSFAQGAFHEDLIRIPMAVKSPEMGVGVDADMISLMSINDIVISLLKKQKFDPPKTEFIRIARSEIYNPDFRYLYGKNKHERGIQAFEGFLFRNGYKLIIYADGESELYETEGDQLIEDTELKGRLLGKIKDYVTVTDVLE